MEQALLKNYTDYSVRGLQFFSQVSAALLFFFLPISTSLTGVFFFLTIALVFCQKGLVANLKMIFSEPLVWMFCLFVLIFIVGLLYGAADEAAQLSTLQHYSRYFFCVFLLPVFLKERARCWALRAFLAAGALTLVLVFLKAAGFIAIRSDADTLTIFKTHIDTGFVLLMSAYIAILFAMKEDNKKLKYAYWFFVFLVGVTTFYLGYSRSVYLVFIGLALLLSFQNYGWRSFVSLAILIPVFLGLVFATSPVFRAQFSTASQGYHQFQTLGDKTNMSSGIRMNFYNMGLSAIKQHWLLGWGSGAMSYAVFSVDKNFPAKVNNLHNEYLNITLQFGILGLLFLLSLFYCVAKTSLSLPFYYNRLMQGVLLSTMLGSLINSWLMDSVEGYFFALIVVLCLASRIEERL